MRGRSGVSGVRHSWPPAVWLSIFLFLVYTGIETAAGQWAYTLFVEGRGISAQAAGLGVSAYWGGLAVGPGAGRPDRQPDRAGHADPLEHGRDAGRRRLIWLNLAAWLSFGGLVLMGLAAAPVFPSLIGVTPPASARIAPPPSSGSRSARRPWGSPGCRRSPASWRPGSAWR